MLQFDLRQMDPIEFLSPRKRESVIVLSTIAIALERSGS